MNDQAPFDTLEQLRINHAERPKMRKLTLLALMVIAQAGAVAVSLKEAGR